ncbi:hypothetical protein FEMY_24840 [Ferrovum myxofaciens]|uniref:Uncharacterized protein n=1 Tax=Ferrovum myxofaciens TaxID=416213 RepID=A0A149VUZ4_9PROT|nr:hypothetical protein FEMY_24840 [Ferrovum myxofaciens]
MVCLVLERIPHLHRLIRFMPQAQTIRLISQIRLAVQHFRQALPFRVSKLLTMYRQAVQLLLISRDIQV